MGIMRSGALVVCAFVVWPIVITATTFCMAWLREASRQRRTRVTPGISGLIDAFLPATLLGPALAGLGTVAICMLTERGSTVGPIVTGVFVSFVFFWPLGIVAFLLGVLHRLYVTNMLLKGDDVRLAGRTRRVLAGMTAINVVSVACELFWLTRPMNLNF